MHTGATCRIPTVIYSKNRLQSFLDSQGNLKGRWFLVTGFLCTKCETKQNPNSIMSPNQITNQSSHTTYRSNYLKLTHSANWKQKIPIQHPSDSSRRSLVLHPRCDRTVKTRCVAQSSSQYTALGANLLGVQPVSLTIGCCRLMGGEIPQVQ